MPPEIEKLGREELLEVVREQYEKNETLQSENDRLKKLIFGAKSERFVPEVDPQQTSLDFGGTPEVEKNPSATEIIIYEREKNNGKQKPTRQPIPAHLERIIHEIQPEEDVTGLMKIGEEVTEELEYTPGKLFVNRYIRPKYVKPGNDGEGTKVLIGNLPERPLPKCIAGPHLLAALIVAKFVDHLPLYRQSQMFKRQGIDIPDATICGWVNAVGRLLKALYEAHKRKVLLSIYLMADETPIGVLESDNPGSLHRGFHWAYYDPVNKLVLFDYRPGRGKEGPKEILKDFKGHLQTDGYAVYDEYGSKAGITLMHCWAHARRKFTEAQDSDRARANYVLEAIQKLYALEREIKETQSNETEVVEVRRERALRLVNSTVAKVKETGDFDGDTVLRAYSLELLSFYQDALENEFKPFLNSIKGDSLTEEEDLVADSLYSRMAMRENQYWERFNWAEKKFYKEHNIDAAETPQ